MDVKAAVALAKNHITDLFAQEGLTNLGLEEVEYDEVREQWRITVGFSRSWDIREGHRYSCRSASCGPIKSS